MSVVLFSGGIGSWAAARRWIETSGQQPILLFTDTLIEDPDLYRFLDDAARDLDIPVTRIADGRTPWQLFHEQGMIGNTRADLCSRILKRELARSWLDEHYPEGTDIIVGFDWTEHHRLEKAEPHWTPHQLIAPLCSPPYKTKPELLEAARSRGIDPPELYSLGFPHNNCGGFCIKQGQGAFVRLLETKPDRYAQHEAEEERFRSETGKDVAVLRDRRGGQTKPLTLRALREEHESGGEQLDLFELGGCDCMI